MSLLKSPANLGRLRLISLSHNFQCSKYFFKWTLPQLQVRDKSVDTKPQKQPTDELEKESQLPQRMQKEPQLPQRMQEKQQRMPEKSQRIPENPQRIPDKPQRIPEKPLFKAKAVAAPVINIKDQRDKWLAKVSPKMQIKARPKAGAEGAKPLQQNSQSFGMPREFQQPQPPKKSPEAQENRGNSVSERNSWMSRMHGGQQSKQTQWLKDMQAKQQAGRDIHEQKLQQIKLQQPATETAPKPEEAPVEVVPKTPERLAYLAAIRQLNGYLIHEPTAGRAQSKTSSDQIDPNIEHTLMCLSQTGFDPAQLAQLPVIQVAGTKGRGTTCLLVEAILRSHGVRTGVLCAPHLFLTSERIRIDGESLEDQKFTELFLGLQSQLLEMQPPPSYNKLLTVMAFHAFRNAKVDVAIVEVGSGCASDCTNITGHAQTIGISTLGWEQSFSLSNSLRDIAWAKAAIMKKAASVYTSTGQTECCEVLGQRAKQLGVELHRVPAYTAYIEDNQDCKQLLNGVNFGVKLNGSLAIQLAYDYLRRHHPDYVVGMEHNSTLLTPGTKRGLELYEQRGQFEIMKHDIFNVYLDSADTLESMMVCREWFYTRTRSSRSPKVLLFSKVNEFNSKDLLTILRHNMRFEEAGFVPSPSFFEGESTEQQEQELEQDKDAKDAISWQGMEELQRARRNASNWRSLCEENGTRDNSQLSISIESFLDHLREKYGKQRYGMRNELDVLVTGSRELVAGTIHVLQKLKDKEFGKWH